MNKRIDPCLSCPLPDCNENSPGCPLKRASAMRRTLVNQGKPIPADIQQGHNLHFRYWTIERKARLSEARI